MSYGDPSGNPNPFSSGPTNPYQSSTPGYIPPPQQQGSPVLSIVSLVCGILGLLTACCCFPFNLILPVAALITGGIALFQPSAQGKGMAIAGVVCGGLAILLSVIIIVVALSNPQMMQDMQRMQQMNK